MSYHNVVRVIHFHQLIYTVCFNVSKRLNELKNFNYNFFAFFFRSKRTMDFLGEFREMFQIVWRRIQRTIPIVYRTFT